MESFPSDDELRAFFGDIWRPEAGTDAENLDWTTSIGIDHGAWTAATSNRISLHAEREFASTILPLTTTAGEMTPQQSAFPQDIFPESGISGSVVNDLSLGSTDFPPMDVLWPDLSEQTFDNDLWNVTLPNPLAPTLTTTLSSTSAEEEGLENSRKKRRRIPPDAKRLLEGCFEHYKEDPYVPQDKIKELAKQTGLSIRQVRTFFANARARKLPPISSSQSPQPKMRSAGMDVPGPGRLQQHPMQRFLSSSPEDEGISEDAVRTAAESTDRISAPTRLRRHAEADAMSVSDMTFSSNSESNSSQASIDSANSRGPRRGRKRQREPTQKVMESIVRKPIDPSKKYQCTFCVSDFCQKYDWRRHEESVHLPQKEWICMPDGPLTYTSSGDIRCVFCDKHAPNDDHLETHNCTSCSTAPRAQRTFLRKDKLIQHLMQVHRCGQTPKGIKEWCRPIERKVTMICGLCGKVLPDWPTRAEHISSHFTDGRGMYMWILERPGGIMPHIAGSEESIQFGFNPIATPDGDFHCEVCPDRFKQRSHAIFHNRQVHNVYSDRDRTHMHVVNVPSNQASSPKKDLIDTAQRFQRRNAGVTTAGITQLERQRRQVIGGGGGGGGGNQTSTPPFNPRVSVSAFSGIPTSRVASNQSLVANPHADWNAIMKSRPKSHLPKSTLDRQQAENIRHRRSNLSKISAPAQGALHSLPADSMN